MIFSSNFKINLSLNLLCKRTDGYTEIETVMYPLGGNAGELCDIVEVVQNEGTGGDIAFTSSGILVDCPPQDNLCHRAFELMHSRYDIPRNVSIHLHKRIPMGAGLGGGSANGVSVLKACNELFELGLGVQELENLAAELGSDTSFFVQSVPAVGRGRGEILEPVAVDLGGYHIMLVKPAVGISTAKAYSLVECKEPKISPVEAIKLPITEWHKVLKNDFEDVIFEQLPVLAMIKSELYRAGALYAAMSGSGSTIFGIFSHRPSLRFSNHFCTVVSGALPTPR